MTMKKFVSTLLTISLVSMFLPHATFATQMTDEPGVSGGVAEVNGVNYDTLLNALDASESGQTITLLEDYTVETDEWTTYLLPENSTLELARGSDPSKIRI